MSKEYFLFRYVEQVSFGKKDILLDPNCEEFERFQKEYNPYAMNGFLASQPDAISLVNEMNTSPKMTPARHFLFLLHTLRRRKRFPKWPQPKKDKDLELISKHYGVSNAKARDFLRLIPKEHLAELRTAYDE